MRQQREMINQITTVQEKKAARPGLIAVDTEEYLRAFNTKRRINESRMKTRSSISKTNPELTKEPTVDLTQSTRS